MKTVVPYREAIGHIGRPWAFGSTESINYRSDDLPMCYEPNIDPQGKAKCAKRSFPLLKNHGLQSYGSRAAKAGERHAHALVGPTKVPIGIVGPPWYTLVAQVCPM